ncbi:hypothetical protein [Paracoccus sp. (in: a-proteobacteria)]|uniref:hypothetical protein n=1 Tax=Paracoccus sp. TaxID=267 RepID=UPI003A866E6F
MAEEKTLRDHFEEWHASMYVYMDNLRAAVPDNIVLDYSLDSLLPLERWVLDRYPDVESARAELGGLAGAAGAYLGETVRKAAGGKWRMDDNEKSVFHGFPVLVEIRGSKTISPLTLITASTDRRKGDYLHSVARYCIHGDG